MLNQYMVSGLPSEKIEIGMPATILSYTDRYPATVIAKTPRTVTVQYDNYKRTDSNGMSESQQYDYEQDPEGPTTRFWLTKRGWRRGCTSLGLGWREHYYDFSF